ncbi:MAG: histidine phosphatase family protein [Kiritimatiellae bacterium]|nr:histidine phosphatase family protein [Kiritimatiellia bacterium]MDW8459523.1 histidine phosphatase family protein [Verrucomicrobiota bacterium]
MWSARRWVRVPRRHAFRGWRAALLLTISSLFALPLAGQALDIFIVRHAETLANATKLYTAFNQRHFTRDGARQIEDLTRALRPYRFDAILTSPAYRTLRTIQPYLVAANAQAEIWPELDECCWQTDPEHELTPPGDPILLEEDQRPYFALRPGAAETSPGAERYDDGIRRVRWAAAEIWRRWGGSDAVILVATHYHTGAKLIETLAESLPSGGVRLQNAKLTHLRESDGRFFIVGLNLDEPGAAAPIRASPP